MLERQLRRVAILTPSQLDRPTGIGVGGPKLPARKAAASDHECDPRVSVPSKRPTAATNDEAIAAVGYDAWQHLETK
jgi:hypothetical protein